MPEVPMLARFNKISQYLAIWSYNTQNFYPSLPPPTPPKPRSVLFGPVHWWESRARISLGLYSRTSALLRLPTSCSSSGYSFFWTCVHSVPCAWPRASLVLARLESLQVDSNALGKQEVNTEISVG